MRRDANSTKPTDLDMAHAHLAELIHDANEVMRGGYKLSAAAWVKLRLAGDEVARLQAELTARRGRASTGGTDGKADEGWKSHGP